MIKFAVISFPGTNCEAESVRAFKRAGMDAEMVLWNDPGILDKSRLNEFDGYLIAGGFSYEDRGRSGIVAAQDPIADILKEEADNGKVIIGICNGAQILVETGLIPGFDNKGLAIALGWNIMKKDDEIVGTGFYNIWNYLKNTAVKGRSAFNDFDEMIYIPMAHGEGRFVVEPDVLEKLEANNQILFKYATEDEQIATEFPDVPNGAAASIAALCNPAGNLMAIMPHPERDPLANGSVIFQSIKRWIQEKKTADYSLLGDYECKEDIRESKATDIDIFVQLIITDNAERTIEETLIRKGYKMHLDRFEYYGIALNSDGKREEAIKKIMATGELANFNKHQVYVRIADHIYRYDPVHGLQQADISLDHSLIVTDKDDMIGESKTASIGHHTGDLVNKIYYGTVWNFSECDSETIDRVIGSKVLYNPHSMYLMKA